MDPPILTSPPWPCGNSAFHSSKWSRQGGPGCRSAGQVQDPHAPGCLPRAVTCIGFSCFTAPWGKKVPHGEFISISIAMREVYGGWAHFFSRFGCFLRDHPKQEGWENPQDLGRRREREGETEPLPPTMIIWSPITTAGAQTFFTTLVSIRNHIFLETW